MRGFSDEGAKMIGRLLSDGGDVLGACQVIFRINQRENKWLTIRELRDMYLILGLLVIGIKVLAVSACRYAEQMFLPF